VVLLFVVAGCSSGTVSGAPTPGPTSSAIAPSKASAPLIANPLSVGELAQDVCSGFADAQLTPFMGVVRRHEASEDVKKVPFCGWDPENGHMAGVTLYVDGNSDNVADLYEPRLGDNFFEKIPLIAGYPAVRRSQAPDGPARGDCLVTVAVADRATISVYANTVGKDFQYYTSMCTVTDKLAEAAIANLRARG
jgi:hypothetical protein